MTSTVLIDCDAGRRLGCATFCCRLIVRYGSEDDAPLGPDGRPKRCVDKDPKTGFCVHLDLETYWCAIWERRPLVCREYDCNDDPLVQIVLRDGCRPLRELLRAHAVPLAARIRIPAK